MADVGQMGVVRSTGAPAAFGAARPASAATAAAPPAEWPFGARGGTQVDLSPVGRQAAADAGGTTLSPEQQEEVRKLAARDREVRAHEQAHLAAAGGLAHGGASYSYKTGPDGKRYAIGGEVNIDASPVEGDPRATLQKAQRVQRAALAPADPSAQDRAVAAQAAAMAVEAQRQLATPAANPPEAGSAAAPAATTHPAASSSGALYRAGEPSTPTGGQFDRRM